MGNQLSYTDFTECPGPPERASNFYNKLNIKWVKYFFQKISDNKHYANFNLKNTRALLHWRDYFNMITEMKARIAIEVEFQTRSISHPATIGRILVKKERVEEPQKTISKPEPDLTIDDHTDDELEEEEDLEEDGEEGEKKDDTIPRAVLKLKNIPKGSDDSDTKSESKKSTSRSKLSSSSGSSSYDDEADAEKLVFAYKKPQEWDPMIYNPIYFGCTPFTVKDHDLKVKNEAIALAEAEKRAIERAKATRMAMIDNFERSCTAAYEKRDAKINDLETKYTESRYARDKELRDNKRDLPPGAYKIYKMEWDQATDGAEAAYEEEVGNLVKIHEEKSAADHVSLADKREEMEAFKDAEEQEMPAAERLEKIARVEIGRWIDELGIRGEDLDKARHQYGEIRKDLEELMEKTAKIAEKTKKQPSPVALKEIQELKSLVGVAETNVKEKQRLIHEALANLDDTEILLQRALRIKAQQEEILPLFELLMTEEDKKAVSEFVEAVNAKKEAARDQSKRKKGDKKKVEEVDNSHDANGITFACKLNTFVMACVLLSCATFDQKYNFIFNLYDGENEGFAGFDFFIPLIMLTQNTLHKMHLIPFTPIQSELENLITRTFMSIGLDPLNDMLTQFESKQMLVMLVSHSKEMTNLLGINNAALDPNISTYQRNHMSPIALMIRGMLPIQICHYRIHYECTKYKRQLNPRHKQEIHERAMAMGEEDPLKPDYSIFITQPEGSGSIKIQPLYNVAYSNIEYLRSIKEHDAAVMFQSIIRASRERKVAAMATKRQAFIEAKEMSIKEMKSKVVSEFRKREAAMGVGKMKWDAQVRMKQAKLKASGQSLGRSDVVMMMMEEAINKSIDDIEVRFRKIEEKEDFAGINFDSKEREVDDPSANLDINALFGIAPKPKVHDESALVDSISTPRPDGPDVDGDGDGEVEKEEVEVVDYSSHEKLSTAAVADKKRNQTIIEGSYKWDPTGRGESIAETELRIAMSIAEPDPLHFFGRLRAIHNSLTAFKVRQLLAELPSKRLLLKYIEHTPMHQLEKELKFHFRFTRELPKIVKIFKNIVKSDIERGVLFEELKALQDKVEMGIKSLNKIKTEEAMLSLEKMIENRLETNDDAREETVIEGEISRMDSHVKKYRHLAAETLVAMENLRQRYYKITLSCVEVEKKQNYFVRYRAMKNGGYMEPMATLDERQSWMKRLSTAMNLPENTQRKTEIKYSEIRSVCKEFLAMALSDAIIIVSEHQQPKHRKTIPVYEEFQIHGRAKESGRGIPDTDGKYYNYEAHNIMYYVCEDYNGIFNGFDEFSAKAHGKDRTASLEYFKCHIPKFNTPLVATIDYGGYRVIAVSKLPCKKIIFTDEGEVRKMSEEQVHGTQKDGEIFINKSRIAMIMVRGTSSKLNLAEHQAKGISDMQHSTTSCSTDIKIFKGLDDEFYAKDFWRAFPPEIPKETPHLLRAPRDQSIFWRQLRPEFVRHYKIPLSPDAACSITATVPDRDKQLKDVTEATRHLVQVVIPNFVDRQTKRKFIVPLSEGLGFDITNEFHASGINIRHIGLMRSMLWRTLPGLGNIYHHEKCVRTRRNLREEVKHGDMIQVNGVRYKVHETEDNKITERKIPIEDYYSGDSINGITILAGNVEDENNNSVLRYLFLGEMIARTVKNLIRLQLRQYTKRTKVISIQFMSALVCQYFNVVTIANEKSIVTLQETIFDAVRERFGPKALRDSERENIIDNIKPVIIYIIKRLQSMLGVNLSITCLSEFHERPLSFAFTPLDLVEVAPVLQHNIPIMALSDAVIVTLQAQEVEKDTYVRQVMKDAPILFLRLSERKGSRMADNKGSLGPDFGGFYQPACQLEQAGPISTDPYTRSVLFLADQCVPFVDTRYHASVVPRVWDQHFSVEVWCRCEGNPDMSRTVLTCGRYSIIAARDNWWAVVISQGMYDVNVRVCPIVENKWVYIVVTFDGLALRVYMDSTLMLSMETETPMALRIEAVEGEIADQLKELEEDEERERALVKTASTEEATKFLSSKDGVKIIKIMSQNIMESKEFQLANHGKDELDAQSTLKAKKLEAIRQAKVKYTTELYVKNVRAVAEKFKVVKDDLTDKISKEREEGVQKSRKPIRIGSAYSNEAPKAGKNFFYGCISSLGVYDKCLSHETVRTHYFSAALDKTKDAQRLHAVASAKYEEALLFAVDDLMVLRGYAKSLCEYLKIEGSNVNKQGISRGKLKVFEAFEKFYLRNVAEGIAEIIMGIPREVEYRDLICKGFQYIWKIDKQFFTKGISMTRKDCVSIPQIFALDHPSNSQEYIETAAEIYREVVKDGSLQYSYGETDLHWLSQLKSAELVCALVKHACEDANLNIVKVGEIFRLAGRDGPMSITDDDVSVMSSNLVLSQGFDLSGCPLITNNSVYSLSRVKSLKVLNLDGCVLVTDKGLKDLEPVSMDIQVLSLVGLSRITDTGLKYVSNNCKGMKIFNSSSCAQITEEGIMHIVTNSTRLNTLHIGSIQINDAGLTNISRYLSKKSMTSMDLSMCRDISDFGILTIAESCPNIRFLNLSGVSRITNVGCRAVCSKCWYLDTLNLEDVFLLGDESFWFSREYDGRPAAEENMLKSLKNINLKDCVNLTTQGIRGLAERCRRIEEINLRGCDKLNDATLVVLSTPYEEKYSMCDSFKILTLSYCPNVTATGIISFLSFCGVLEELNISGIIGCDDDFLHQLCLVCKTVQKLELQKCVYITDAGLCSLADYMWIEYIDITGCYKITDDGIEVLTSACNGLIQIIAKKISKLTDRSMNAILRNCKLIQKLDITDCPLITQQGVKDLSFYHHSIKIIR